MRRLLIAVPVAVAAMLVGAPAAFATSPHFVSASASLKGSNLQVSFKEAGLGTNQNLDYTASANASATYVCVNNGGGNPSASNKKTVEGPVSGSGEFNSGKNGSVSASLTLGPPIATGFSCPHGQSMRTAQVSYTDVNIADTTDGVTEPISGTFSTGCLLPDVRGACD
jgi:hypothetical protein